MLSDCKYLILTGLLVVYSHGSRADTIHDPTAPKIAGQISAIGTFNRAAEVAEAELKLQGIVNKKDTRMAIISGQLHRVGEVVNGYLISQVNKNNVVLTKSGSQKRLYVYE